MLEAKARISRKKDAINAHRKQIRLKPNSLVRGPVNRPNTFQRNMCVLKIQAMVEEEAPRSMRKSENRME